MVEHLLSHGAHIGDGLLRAVGVGFEETVEKICAYVAKLPVMIFHVLEILFCIVLSWDVAGRVKTNSEIKIQPLL